MPSPQDVAVQLAALRDAYARDLPAKVQDLAESWDTYCAVGLQDFLHTAHRKAHSLTGSAATFGFLAVSDAAWALEQALAELTEQSAPLDPTHRAGIAERLDTLRSRAAQPREAVFPAVIEAACHGSSGDRTVLLLEDREELAAQLLHELCHYGYVVRRFTAIDALEQALQQSAPAAMVVDLDPEVDLAEGNRADSEAIAAIRDRCPNVPPVIFLSQCDDLQTRLAAVRAGGAAYFRKPVSAADLAERLNVLTSASREAPFRILIVDGDAAMARHTELALQRAGMSIRVLTDPAETFAVLEEFRPELLLLDLYLPGCTGIELAAVIRQQEAFHGMAIVFYSVETDIRHHLAAMRAGGDDFLIKPKEPWHLAADVAARVSRARSLSALMAQDSLTGLLNHSSIEEQLIRDLAAARRHGKPVAYALLDLDHFKDVNDDFGHAAGDRVLRALAHLLRRRLRESDRIGRYGGEEFALVLPETNVAAAKAILDEVREAFCELTHMAAGRSFKVTLSGGVAAYPHYSDAVSLHRAADMALYRAKAEGRDCVVAG